MIAIIVVACALFCTADAEFQQPFHASLTQEASVLCQQVEGGYNMTFKLVVNADNVEMIYAINKTDPMDTSVGQFDIVNMMTGDGTSDDPYSFTIEATGIVPNSPLALSDMEQNIKKAYILEPDVMGVNIMVKSQYRSPAFTNLLFADDVIYTAQCNCSDIQDQTIATGQISVAGSLDEIPTTSSENFQFQVFTNGTPATSLGLEEMMVLKIVPATPTYAKGVYVYSCKVCNTQACDGLELDVLVTDGCSVGNVVPPFERDGIGASTAEFKAFVFLNTNQVFIQCNVGVCYEENDARCDSYCKHNAAGRKRRQAPGSGFLESPDETITTSYFITVTSDKEVILETAEQRTEESRTELVQAQETNMALLGTVVALAVLFIVALITAICVYVRLTPKQKNKV